jgi:hypothetical protein
MSRALLVGFVAHARLTIFCFSFALVAAQPTLQFLSAALLRGRQMPFALLRAQ